jgi:hypothetical protein
MSRQAQSAAVQDFASAVASPTQMYRHILRPDGTVTIAINPAYIPPPDAFAPPSERAIVPFLPPAPFRADLIHLLFTKVGSVDRNMSNSAWRKSSLQARFDSATARQFEISYVCIYHSALHTAKIQDNAVIGYIISDFDSVSVRRCTNSTIATVLPDLVDVPFSGTLQNALALRASHFDFRPPPPFRPCDSVLLGTAEVQPYPGVPDFALQIDPTPGNYTRSVHGMKFVRELSPLDVSHSIDSPVNAARAQLSRLLLEVTLLSDSVPDTFATRTYDAAETVFRSHDATLSDVNRSISHIYNLIAILTDAKVFIINPYRYARLYKYHFRLMMLHTTAARTLAVRIQEFIRSVLPDPYPEGEYHAILDHFAMLMNSAFNLLDATDSDVTSVAQIGKVYLDPDEYYVDAKDAAIAIRNFYAPDFPWLSFDTFIVNGDALSGPIPVEYFLTILRMSFDFHYPTSCLSAAQAVRRQALLVDSFNLLASLPSFVTGTTILSYFDLDQARMIHDTSAAQSTRLSRMIFADTLIDKAENTIDEARSFISDLDPALRKVVQLTDDLSDTNIRVNTLIDETSSTAHAVNDFASAAHKLTSDLQTFVTSLTDSIKLMFGDTPSITSRITSAIPLLIDLVDGSCFHFTNKVYASGKLILRILNLFDIPSAICEEALQLVEPYLRALTTTIQINSMEKDFAAHQTRLAAGHDFSVPQTGSNSFLSLLTALVGTIILGVLPDKTTLKNAIEFARGFNVFVPATKNVFEFLEYIISFLPTCIQNWIRCLCPSDTFYETLVKGGRFRIWREDVLASCSESNGDRVLYDLVLQDHIHDLYRQGQDLLTDCAESIPSHAGAKINTLIFHSVQQLQKFESLIASRANTDLRPTPFCIYIAGDPGIGKSTIVPSIVDLLCPKGLPARSKCYVRNASNKFWDSYIGQFAVHIDDFFQNRQVDDVTPVFDIVSCAPLVLPMASLDDPSVGKKGTKFTSELLILTSNTAYPRAEDSRSNEALLRRRHVLIQAVLDENCKLPSGKPDVSKFQPDMSHLTFKLLDSFEPSAPLATFQCVDDLFKHLFSAYQKHVKTQLQIIANRSGPLTTIVADIRRTFDEHDTSTAQADTLHDIRPVDISTITDPNHFLRNYALPQEANLVTRFNSFLTPVKSRVDDCDEAFKELLNKSKTWLDAHPRIALALRIAGLALSFGLPALIAFKMYTAHAAHASSVAENTDERAQQRAIAAKRARYRAETVKRPDSTSSIPAYRAEASDPSAATLVHQRIMPNMVRLSVISPDGLESTVCGFMLKGTAVLAPHHLFVQPNGSLIDSTYRILLTHPTEVSHPDIFDRTRLVSLTTTDGKSKDAVIYLFTNRIQPARDSTEHFIREKDIDYYQRFEADLISLNPTPNKPFPLAHCVEAKPLIRPVDYNVSDHKEGYTLFHGWEYVVASWPGMCGSLLIAHNPRMQNKIVAMHVAGSASKNLGQSEIVTYESIQRALATFPSAAQSTQSMGMMSDLLDLERARVIPQGNFTPIGVLPPSLCPRAPDKSDIVPSPLHDLVYLHTTEPACLTPTDPRLDAPTSMIVNGCEKFGRPAQPLDPELLRQAVDHVKHIILSTFAKNERFIATDNESINGKPALQHCEPLNFDTSPGYPYVLTRPARSKGKAYLFEGEAPDRWIKDPILLDRFHTRESLALDNKRIDSLWISCLKDERRPLNYVKIGKTRTFIYAPADLVLLSRKYFMAFNAAFFGNALRFFSAAGIDPESYDWTIMTNRLLEVSDSGFAGDFGNYDGTLIAEVIDAVCDIINAWYNDSFPQVRKVLFSEYIHTQMCCLSTVFYKHSGNPSGNPLTTPINSIANAIYMSYCWLKLAPAHLRDLSFFSTNVRFFVYGDDNIFAVTPQALPFFNMKTVSAELATYGLDYTTPDKTSSISVEHAPVLSWTFLKRGFRKYKNFYFPLMNQSTITESVNWIRKSPDPWTQTLQSVSSGLRFAFFYGAEYFNAMRDAVLEVCQSLGRTFPLPTYEYYNQQFGATYQLPTLVFHATGGTEAFYEKNFIRPPPPPHDTSSAQSAADASPLLVNSETTHGVTLLQQSEPITAAPPGTTDKHTEGDKHLKDAIWTLNMMVEKPALVNVTPWSTGSAHGTVLAVFNCPFDLVTSTVNHQPFNDYTFWRGVPTVKFQVNGTKFHTGRLIAFFVPLTNAGVVAGWHVQNFAAATSVTHVMLDPAVNTIAELKIPFINQQSHINLRDVTSADFLGTLVLMVFNQLQVGAGASTTVNVSMTVEFNENEFKVPAPTGQVFRDANIQRKLTRKAQHDKSHAQGNTFTTTNNQTYKDVASLALQQNTTGEEIGRGASAHASLDKPNCGLEPPLVQITGLGFMANSTNITHLERFMHQPGPLTIATPETFGTTIDEMSLDHLFSIWNYDSRYNWTTSQPVGGSFVSRPVCPNPEALNSLRAVGTYYNVTTLDYCSMKASFWTGSIEYKIQVIASEYHTGKLFVGMHYGITSPNLSSVDDLTSQSGLYIDLGAGTHEYIVSIPYISSKQMLRVPNGIEALSNQLNFCTGYWTLTIINPLVAPAGVSTNVDINIYKRGGPDYAVHYYGANNSTIVPADHDPGTPSLRIHDVSEAQSGKTYYLSPSTPSAKVYPTGERIDNISDIIKRYARFTNEYGTMVSGLVSVGYDISAILFTPAIDLSTTAVSPYAYRQSGLISYYSAMYRAHRGSWRFKTFTTSVSPTYIDNTATVGPTYVSNRAPVTTAVLFSPDATSKINPPLTTPQFYMLNSALAEGFDVVANTNTQYGMIGAPIQVATSEPGVNMFEIPYVSQYKFLLIQKDLTNEPFLFGTDYSSNGTIFFQFTGSQPGAAMQYNNASYVAAGDETRFGIYLGPPVIYILPNAFPDTY